MERSEHDGLYTARFRTPLDDASGVVVVLGDTVYGGDTGMYYFGRFAERDGEIEVNLEIRRHNEATHSVFGDFDGFKMTLKGRKVGDEWRCEGRADAAPSLRFECTLRKARL